MSRYIVESLTDPRAKITAQTWGNVTDIVAPVKQFLQASALQQLTISPDVLIAMTGGGVFKTTTTILTVADLDTGSAFVFGRDYYVYCCDPGDGISDEVYKISLNSTYPAGYTAATSRKIGGFHYGQVRNSATIADVSIGIVPRSVWTTFWRPKCDPEGMVYLTGGIWADIYLSSDDGNGGLRSVYNATPITGTEGLNWYIALEKLRRSGKRMPSYAEFCMAAEGSPEGLDSSNDQAWSATSNSGRHATGTIAKATSLIGCRDLVGNVWKWVDELCLDPTASSWDWKDVLGAGYGDAYIPSDTALRALVCGGDWGGGVHGGSRAVNASSCPWYVVASVGVWGVCDSL